MDIQTAVTMVAPTGLFAAAIFLTRNLILTRLTQSVSAEFNQKLEELRSTLRNTEEALKSELRLKEAEIAALRSGALGAMASRQSTLDKRRLEAVDQLWQSVQALNQARSIMVAMALMNWDFLSKQAQTDKKTRSFLESIGNGFEVKALDLSGASRAQPFLVPIVWARFQAYQMMCMHGVMRWTIARNGMDPKGLEDGNSMLKLIKAALPEHGSYIEKHGFSGYPHIIQLLQDLLLEDIRAMLAGSEFDKATVKQSAEIVRLANEIGQRPGPSDAGA